MGFGMGARIDRQHAQPVISAVSIKAPGCSGRTVVHDDFKLTAIRPQQVVEASPLAAERKRKGGPDPVRLPQGGKAVRKIARERVRLRLELFPIPAQKTLVQR